MIKYAVKNEIDVIFVAGDIFHVYNPSEKLLKILVWFIKLAIKNGVAVRFITGNHDTDGINYAFESLKNLAELNSFDSDYPMLAFFPLKENQSTIYTEDIKGTCVVYVPWQNNMAEVLVESRGLKSNSKPNVLITHCAVDGASTNSGYEMKRTKITKKILSGWDYVALGDFHKYQEVMPNVYYSGSIVKTVWDERHDKRSFNFVQIGDGIHNTTFDVKRVNLPDDEFIEMELKYESIGEFTTESIESIDGKKIKNSYIKIFVSGEIGIGEKLNTLKLHLLKSGANDVQIKIINNVIKTAEGNIDTSDMNLNLDVHSACMMYLEQQGITDTNYKNYIEKILINEK